MNSIPSDGNFHSKFAFSRAELSEILDTALSRGGDFAEIFLEYQVYSFIKMEDDIIKETAESISLGAGIRVIAQGKTGFAYTNDLDMKKMAQSALTAAVIAQGSPGKSPPLQFREFSHQFYPIKQSTLHASLNSKIDLVKQAYASAQQFDARVKIVKAGYTDQTQYTTLANSEGLLISDTKPLVRLTCVVIAEQNGHREAGYYGGGGRVGMEYFSKCLTPHEVGTQAAQEAIHLLEAVAPPAGEMPVVLAPGHSGVLIHEAVGHLLEADFIRKKTSIFWDKMGKQVGTEQVNIFDDPTLPHFRGSYNMDDEGSIPRKTPLITAGRITGLLQDRLSASILKADLTGHGRRQDFTCIPIPRMSNTYIDQGEYSPEEILKSVKRGFYAQLFQGGQVEDSGKFTFSVSSGFLIENGRLTTPVKQATLIGSNIDILGKITMVGSDLTFGLQTGTCGKEGQGAPVTDGCPTLKIESMTVGGQS